MNSYLTWAEIDLKAVSHNVRELRKITNPNAELMAVVKANAYGHGLLEVAGTALENGADSLGVARLCEGKKIREAGFDAPILILGYTPLSDAEEIVKYDLTQTVCSFDNAYVLSEAAGNIGKKIKIHLKVDTGMGRLGLLSDKLVQTDALNADDHGAVTEVESIFKLPGAELEGIFTHFATADSNDKKYAKKQMELFSDFIDTLSKAGIEIPVKHAANSAAVIDMPESHLDMVRTGISLYGLYPSNEVNKNRISLLPAMEFKSKIVHLKSVPEGFKVSYGASYETEKATNIATIPVGYADGYNRLLSSKGQMIICGKKAPVIGRVCMDLTMLDVGHIPDAALEDEVVIFGKQGDISITADEVASSLKTINYEVVSTITERVPRIFLK
ncbi:MAG: alanine racemase [Desulfobacteraceae bacterium]|nr:alanine racemase [Desulfobacteraceae bacterium]